MLVIHDRLTSAPLVSPPDTAVVPPMYSSFSSTKRLRPVPGQQRGGESASATADDENAGNLVPVSTVASGYSYP